MIRFAAFLIALFSGLAAANAQSLAEIEKREAALVDTWQKTPLTVRHALFVTSAPGGFGQYEERPTNVFQPGEKLLTYAEPVGFGWKDIGGGQYMFGFHADFTIYDSTGKELTSHKDFAYLEEKSRTRNREFNISLTLSVTGASPGDYVLEYRLRDVASDKSTSFKLPFKIAG